MGWLFRRRKPEGTDVKDAVKVRDDLYAELGEATSEVDRLNDRMLADYLRAEKQRLGEKR